MSPRTLADLSAPEVLGLALEVERSNATRFATVRDFFSHQDQVIYALFDELHAEELEHLRILEKAVAEMFPEGVPRISEQDVVEVIEAVDVDDGEHAIFDDITSVDALRMALDAERYAKSMYTRAASQTEEASLKKVFELLASLEADHETRLVEMIEAAEVGE